MAVKLEKIDPLNSPEWDEILLSSDGYSFFHTSYWARVLQESYPFKPSYLSSIQDHQFEVLIPLMEVDSILTGKRGVSLPFSDYCEPIVSEKIERKEVLEWIKGYAEEAGWKHIEIRGSGNLFKDPVPSSSYYFRHTLNLMDGEDSVFSNFRSNAQRNIRKAAEEGVEVKIDFSFSSLEEFYRLHCMTRKEHGVPPQPFYFFRKIYDHILSKDHGFVSLASYKGKVVASTVYFHFGKKALYKYGASDKTYQHLRPNNLAMWEAIQWYCREGYESLCLGRTDPENAGLRQFKNSWGAEETRLQYFRYNTAKKAFVFDHPSGAKALAKKVFKRMPVSTLKIIGKALYRHVD